MILQYALLAKAFLTGHWQFLMTVLGLWVFAATRIARMWPKPPVTAPWYDKAIHFAVVDFPSFAATLNGKTWMGLTFSIPFFTWTVRGLTSEVTSDAAATAVADVTPAEAPNARTKQSGRVNLPLLLLLGLATIGAGIGCKTTYGKAYSTCVSPHIAQLPATAAQLPAQVEAVLLTAATAGAGAAALEGLVDAWMDGGFLVSCAVTAWVATHPATGDMGVAPAQLQTAHAAAHVFLAKHPAATSCRAQWGL